MSAKISIEITSKGFPSMWRRSGDTLPGTDMRICGRDGWEHIPIFVRRETGDSLHIIHEGDTLVQVSLDPPRITIQRIVKIDRDAKLAEVDQIWDYDSKARAWNLGHVYQTNGHDKPPITFDDAIADAFDAATTTFYRPRVAGSA